MGESGHWPNGFGSEVDQSSSIPDDEEMLPPEVEQLHNATATDDWDHSHGVAIVGMSVKVAGADNLEEFWNLICRAESQHQQLSPERHRNVSPQTPQSEHFVRDRDTFDHRFFKKSPREAATMDPQQRLFLQSAYEAVCHSGYFSRSDPDVSVGVFVGMQSADYENNVACHPANAFSATGNLRAFTAGKVSHYFGWTGPAMTVDTAEISSTVAIHRAREAILSGECTAALAGGVAIMTSAAGFDYPAQAGLLSPTGQSRPLDAAADGYCKGEAVACVLLKRTSQAVQDGDHILGYLDAVSVGFDTHVSHADVEPKPGFVPSSTSLVAVVNNAVRNSGHRPEDITVIEACGTGLPAADEIQYQSIKQVVERSESRCIPAALGSIKGLIGHTEAVSGVVGLIKVLLMMHHGTIPPQPSFDPLQPNLEEMKSDLLAVPKQQVPWSTKPRVALISSYSVPGSVAAMVLSQRYDQSLESLSTPKEEEAHPFWIAAHDQASLREYSAKLAKFVTSNPTVHFADLAYNVFRQSNRSLSERWICTASTPAELTRELEAFVEQGENAESKRSKAKDPVILCFGDAFPEHVGIELDFYRSTALFRKYVDDCNAALLAIGAESLYPAMFNGDSVQDIRKRYSIIFAIQYACAKCWIDSGVEVSAVLGAGLGEPTCLAITGTCSLQQSLRATVEQAEAVMQNPNVRAGSVSIYKVTRDTAKSEQPDLRWERVFENASGSSPEGSLLTAFQRLQQDFPSALWLEAGSTSSITDSARKALKSPMQSHFRAVDLSSHRAIHSLTEVLAELWQGGLNIHHWAHHSSQAQSYGHLLLPQYQFRKSRHWLELKSPPRQSTIDTANPRSEHANNPFTFVGYQNNNRQHARFRVNTEADEVKTMLVAFHCAPDSYVLPPAALIGIAIDALLTICPKTEKVQPQALSSNLDFSNIPWVSSAGNVWLDLVSTAGDFAQSSWKVTMDGRTTPMKGEITLHPHIEHYRFRGFERYAQIVEHRACLDLLNSAEVDDKIRGRALYRVFADVLPAAGTDQPIHTWAAKGNTSVARLRGAETLKLAFLRDVFLQVGSLWGNNADSCPSESMYVMTGIDSWYRGSMGSPRPDLDSARSAWHVLAFHRKTSDEIYDSDIFVFEANSGNLVETVLGVRYTCKEKSKLFADAPGSPTKQAVDEATPTMSTERLVPVVENPSEQVVSSAMSEAFSQVKALTDQFIEDNDCRDYLEKINPLLTQLCITLALEAFDQLGCQIRTAPAGSTLSVVTIAPQHTRLQEYLYDMLEHDGKLIAIDNESGQITRTNVVASTATSDQIVAQLEADFETQNIPSRLTYHCGHQLAGVLAGAVDGLAVIFGDPAGLKLATALYGDSPLNVLAFRQTAEVIRRALITELVEKPKRDQAVFRVLEMGAGTGGATKHLLPAISSVDGIAVEYTFTDVAASFVRAASRKRWSAAGDASSSNITMKFSTHDISMPPSPDLLATQDLVIAANAVHATSSLVVSLRNTRRLLRPGGCLMLVEMTEPLRWVDMVFGLLKDWWSFEDGRSHALAPPERWGEALREAGFGQVDWTEGMLPESRIQRVIFATNIEGASA